MNLPNELLMQILESLPLPDLNNASKTCRLWHILVGLEVRKRVTAGVSSRQAILIADIPKFSFTDICQPPYDLEHMIPSSKLRLREIAGQHPPQVFNTKKHSFRPWWGSLFLA